MDFMFEGTPPEELAKLLEMMPELRIAPSPLVGVVPVAQVEAVNGLTIEMLALEVREAGAFASWRALADRSFGFLQPHVSITDDLGTEYRALAGNGGGNERSWAGEIAMTPAPPAGAILTIVVDGFGPDERIPLLGRVPPAPVTGPWRFAIETRDIRRR